MRNRTRTNPDTFSNASDPAFLILISLAGGEKHGYGMMQDIKEFAGQEMGPGTLYGAISRLESAGLIEPGRHRERRRPYRLTAAGARALEARTQNLRELVETALSRSNS